MTTSKERILPKHRPHLPEHIKTFGEEINWYIWLWVFLSNHTKHSIRAFLLLIWLSNSNEMMSCKNFLFGVRYLFTQTQGSLLPISNTFFSNSTWTSNKTEGELVRSKEKMFGTHSIIQLVNIFTFEMET